MSSNSGAPSASASASAAPPDAPPPLEPRAATENALAPSRTTEVYGFVARVLSVIAYGLYLLWAFLPRATLETWGVSYYPDQYWALAIPAMLCVTMWAYVIAVGASMLVLTQPLDEYSTIFDCHTKPPLQAPSPESIPPLHDIPISVVSRLLYTGSPSGETPVSRADPAYPHPHPVSPADAAANIHRARSWQQIAGNPHFWVPDHVTATRGATTARPFGDATSSPLAPVPGLPTPP